MSNFKRSKSQSWVQGGSPPRGLEESKLINKVRWKKPHPDQVFTKMMEAMDGLGDKIVASAMRQIALAEANDVGSHPWSPTVQEVVEWLELEIEHLRWVVGFIEEHQDMALRGLIPALLPAHMWRLCRWCDQEFVPVRRGHDFCSGACRQAAYRDRKLRWLAIAPEAERLTNWAEEDGLRLVGESVWVHDGGPGGGGYASWLWVLTDSTGEVWPETLGPGASLDEVEHFLDL